VDAADIDPLVGMRLLDGYELTVQAIVGGAGAHQTSPVRESIWGEEANVPHTGRAEPGTGADALQLTLRFSFRARLTASVRLQGKAGWRRWGATRPTRWTRTRKPLPGRQTA
jgi:hypothetical protein